MEDSNNFKVLMTLMGMEIGGAETHVLELCKELKRRGVSVYVASNGGAYEKELKDAGVVHYKVPLHNKRPHNLVSAYFAIKKIIIENDIKLVHAHARIPAFLCGLLRKRMQFRFVTSAHFMFVSTFAYKFLTDWGEKTLAVSNDLKQYLIDTYNEDEKNITVTVNGIDTDKFSMKTAKTYGKKIVCVSRLDKEPAAFIHILVEAAEELAEYGASITIVGSGTEFAKIAEHAEEANKRAGKRVVNLTGARTDINNILRSADIFVGISRAALEAMSCELPVILAGPYGYIGRFDESTLPVCIETNFTCRGQKPVTAAELTADILALLEETKVWAKLGRYGRQIVSERYSVEKMCEDALFVYNSMRVYNKKYDFCVFGYYGSNNNGDDALLKSVIDDLREKRPDANLIVLSRKPKETSQNYNTRSVYLFNLPVIYSLLKDVKVLMSGGGTLLQDLTSTRSLVYYLLVIKLAKKRGARVMLYANGIGPVQSAKNRARITETLRIVDLITLRDKQSYDFLNELVANLEEKPPAYLTADAAFALKMPPLLDYDDLPDAKYFVVCVRSWNHLNPQFDEHISAFADYVTSHYGYTPVFLAMQPCDTEISQKIAGKVKGDTVCLGKNLSTEKILTLMARAEFVISMRLHAIIYAARTATPCIGLVYDPKVEAMMKIIEQNYYLSVENTDHNILIGYAVAIAENREKIKARIRAGANEQSKRAAQNVAYALALLDAEEF
ncbi:hypothetical protein AGMMS49975_17450 [Clostridia bacterium]|nr:hypothetical protein AGMMS49975_17450 [Clostridia bacterium]